MGEPQISPLHAAGYPQKANDILYAGKERERCDAWDDALFNVNGEKYLRKIMRAVGLELLKWTIGHGYGYRYFRSLGWVLLFTGIGALVYGTTSQAQPQSIGEIIWLSFDRLLPIIELDKQHYNIPLTGWQCYYFYSHTLIGFVLGSFILAGLSGITKK